MKIAVIGSGISGLSASYYLSKKFKVDLFEKEDRFGGHSYTLKVLYDQKNKKHIDVDIGFIVFNEKTYPNLITFFNELGVEYEKSDMSFSVSVENTNIEYCGRGIEGVFSNRKNILNLNFIKMFYEIIRFYNKCEKLDIDKTDERITIFFITAFTSDDLLIFMLFAQALFNSASSRIVFLRLVFLMLELDKFE